jgi:uncharacterized membrane protein
VRRWRGYNPSYWIRLEDAVVVTKGQDGRVLLDHAIPLVSFGAAGGTLWGNLIGMLCFAPLLGMAMGLRRRRAHRRPPALCRAAH